MNNPNRVYMKVTRDEYELPVAFGETMKELADVLGISKNTVAGYLKRGSNTFVVVDLDGIDSE